jgi:hypothetical protein
MGLEIQNENEGPDKELKPNNLKEIATHKACNIQLLLTSGLHRLDIGMSEHPR